MAQTIKLKRSATSGAVPTTSALELGEVAINTHDGKMYLKKNDGSDSVVEVSGDKLPLSGGTLTGNLAINKTSPEITLNDTNSSTGSYPKINFTTTTNQGVSLYHSEFDSELPVAGYGLVLDATSYNSQYPTTGTLSLVVKGEIYAGSTTLADTKKVGTQSVVTTTPTSASGFPNGHVWYVVS